MTNTTTTKRKRRMAREPKASEGAVQGTAATQTEQTLDKAAKSAPNPNKTEKVLALLTRTGGATLDELVEATGWLPHTTRAALTGLKKKGHHIERTKVDGVSRYAATKSSGQ
jgi:hypothetical protein